MERIDSIYKECSAKQEALIQENSKCLTSNEEL